MSSVSRALISSAFCVGIVLLFPQILFNSPVALAAEEEPLDEDAAKKNADETPESTSQRDLQISTDRSSSTLGGSSSGQQPGGANPNQVTVVELNVVFRDHYHEGQQGKIRIALRKAWAPHGYKRVLDLLNEQFFTDLRFFRSIRGFVSQFGISGDPKIAAKWRSNTIKYIDPVHHSNSRGTLVFAMDGEMKRTSQLFINFSNNRHLDGSGFAPVGEVIAGMHHVDKIYTGYGDEVDQGKVQMQGNSYLDSHFPMLTVLESATILWQGEDTGNLDAKLHSLADQGGSSATSTTSTFQSWFIWILLGIVGCAGFRHRRLIVETLVGKKAKLEAIPKQEAPL